ncbi:dihydrofolate reductase family protein [Mucilaginibacter sp. dw_454]|uniref:dihydrofolate reductase family protein n=1 Tax=Mucilaginibacter sp. dw_454 TaxID=2720079 RepID=UPI0021070FF1|nr:dihydrofolate reductase family protein [Mucilaginibacter sp. dw_454]
MRRIIVSMNITIDGFMAGPDGGLDWHLQNWSTDMSDLLAQQLNTADTILLGKNTYSAMAGYWPAVSTCLSLSREDLAYADMINRYPKVVCSRTLKTLRWANSKLISANIRQEILKLKQQPGKNILIYGSHKLVQYLNSHNLIDEYLLWLYPVSIGSGMQLFKQRQNLQLINTQTLPSGVVVLKYSTGIKQP